MSKKFIFAVLFGYAALINQSAASTFNWTANIQIIGGFSAGSGQLEAQDILSTSLDGLYTGYLLTSITGTYAGQAITGLADLNTVDGNDNLINTSEKLVDHNGIAFTLAATPTDYGSNLINVYSDTAGYTDNGPAGSSASGFTLTAVPIPAAIWMFGSALAGLVGFGRRKLLA
ncbi:MAG: VPLPA-CTERM sorting domain-containing protein [Methylococcaceae bacterium]